MVVLVMVMLKALDTRQKLLYVTEHHADILCRLLITVGRILATGGEHEGGALEYFHKAILMLCKRRK